MTLLKTLSLVGLAGALASVVLHLLLMYHPV